MRVSEVFAMGGRGRDGNYPFVGVMAATRAPTTGITTVTPTTAATQRLQLRRVHLLRS